ncbi:MAG: AMP-binding protein, partial [Syntrophothermus sp.]
YDSIINKKHTAAFLSTTGTTGTPFKVPVSREFIYHQWAVFWKFRMIHGLNMDSWCAYFHGKFLFSRNKKQPPYWIQSWSTKQLLMSIVHLNRDTVESYLCEIKKRGIRWIHAYPSVLILLAELIAEKNLHDFARSLNLFVITTSSETITCEQKEKVENIFGSRVRQLYGLTEGVANIFECEMGKLHVDESFSLVEFLPETNNENYYKIIGSHYHNRAFPLIRYDTGDICRISKQAVPCPCGRLSRVVDEITGREQDFLFLADNSKIVSPDLIFRNISNIRKVQIIQNKPGHADFYITKNQNFSSSNEADIKRNIADYLGNSFTFRLIYTTVMPLEKNGKWPFVVRDL